MIQHLGNFPIMLVEASKFIVEGFSKELLMEEVLASQDRLSPDPTLALFEDTVFRPSPWQEGARLLSEIDGIARMSGLRIMETWSQVHQPLESTGLHHHLGGGASHAFVYYVSVPEGAGMLTFEFEGGATHTIKPTEGELYVFPSWAKHKVSKNLSSSVRISISGNLIPY